MPPAFPPDGVEWGLSFLFERKGFVSSLVSGVVGRDDKESRVVPSEWWDPGVFFLGGEHASVYFVPWPDTGVTGRDEREVDSNVTAKTATPNHVMSRADFQHKVRRRDREEQELWEFEGETSVG